MNRFVKSRSWLFLALTSVCILCLFGDGANLTDLYTKTTTLHFEEVSSETGQDISIPTTFQSTCTFAHFTHRGSFSLPLVPSLKRVILDQDSPSLEAVSIFTSESHAPVPKDEAVSVPFVHYSSSLYLEHCTLLI
ncbi:MAG TPA: hypothetical protein VLY03_13570 [Bacteroidota bacterium]|nr:hypothetical protein [Bacteroidota bacterium]